MTQSRKSQDRDHATSTGGGRGSEHDRGLGRHDGAVALLESAVEPLVEDLGYELLLLEWLGSSGARGAGGKHRVLRIYLDSPAGVTVGDCTRVGRILSSALDAHETAPEAGATGLAGGLAGGAGGAEPEVETPAHNPALAALLGKPYTLEVSSPGVDRPLTRRRHFADRVGARVKIETLAPLEPGRNEKKFYGRIVAVEQDPSAPDDQRRGVVVVHDADGDRTLRVPLPRIRRANLVWEG